jgi:hypothetical protein
MHAPAPEEVAQVRPHGGLVGFTIGWSGPMFGIFIAHIALKFKPPPKTLEELWLEALLREQESEANVGSCPCPGAAASSSLVLVRKLGARVCFFSVRALLLFLVLEERRVLMSSVFMSAL